MYAPLDDILTGYVKNGTKSKERPRAKKPSRLKVDSESRGTDCIPVYHKLNVHTSARETHHRTAQTAEELKSLLSG